MYRQNADFIDIIVKEGDICKLSISINYPFYGTLDSNTITITKNDYNTDFIRYVTIKRAFNCKFRIGSISGANQDNMIVALLTFTNTTTNKDWTITLPASKEYITWKSDENTFYSFKRGVVNGQKGAYNVLSCNNFRTYSQEDSFNFNITCENK